MAESGSEHAVLPEIPTALAADGGASQGDADSALDPGTLSAHLAVLELQVPKPRSAGYVP